MFLAVGMDPQDFAVARVASNGQFFGRSAEKVGWISSVSPQAQASSSGAEGQTRD